MAEDYSWTHVAPAEGEQIGSMLVKIRANQLGGDFSMMQAVVAPHQLLVPHTHTHEDQAVFVIDGELEFEVGGEGGTRFTAGAGSYIIKPRGISHGFWNKTDKTTVYIELSGREGFEGFVDSTAENTLVAAAKAEKDYGVTFHYDRVPKLMKDNRLTSVAGMDMPWEGAKPPSWARKNG